MVTATDAWLDELSDVLIGRSSDELHEVSVGTGSGSEGPNATSLSNEVYSSNKLNDDVFFTDEGNTGQYEAHIQVSAGGSTANVSPDTTITEIAVITKEGTLAIIDEFNGVTIPAGNVEEFIIPADYVR